MPVWNPSKNSYDVEEPLTYDRLVGVPEAVKYDALNRDVLEREERFRMHLLNELSDLTRAVCRVADVLRFTRGRA